MITREVIWQYKQQIKEKENKAWWQLRLF
jgi:hypothetical protein